MTRTCLGWVFAAVASAAGPAGLPRTAATGELKYVACGRGLAIDVGRWYAQFNQFRKPEASAGTVHRGAAMAPLRCGGQTILAAVDARTPDAKAPNVVRFDFTGSGKFDDANVADLKVLANKPDQKAFSAVFGPATLKIERGGRTIPVTVEGQYSKQHQYRWLHATFTVAAETTCRFGRKTLPVRVIDGTGNLTLGDAAEPVRRAGKTVGIRKGDTVAVDTGAGSFADAGAVRRTYFGQPIFVGGAWYQMKLSQYAASLSAEPMRDPTGHVRADHERPDRNDI